MSPRKTSHKIRQEHLTKYHLTMVQRSIGFDADQSAEGPIARNASGVIRASVVRFKKSITDKPDENRAERAVGKTWFGPPT